MTSLKLSTCACLFAIIGVYEFTVLTYKICVLICAFIKEGKKQKICSLWKVNWRKYLHTFWRNKMFALKSKSII